MFKYSLSAAAIATLMIGGMAEAKPPVQPAPQASAQKVRPPHARISMAKARAIALRAAPGKVISAEYENEGGGWRYSFDIQQHNNVQEIGIDGQSGKIVENKSEGPKDHD